MSAARRQIIVVKDAPALAQTAAQRLVACIERGPAQTAICLTGGSTPKRLYELLAVSPWREQIPWPRVHWFIGDDRFVPQDNPLSNTGMARRAFLDACAPPQNVHPIRTDVATPDEAARLYESELRAFGASRGGGPLFDLVLLGVGPDGHTASLFPGFPAANETKLWVAGVPVANVAPFVPRVSLTLPCLESAHEVLFMASGHDKKSILSRVFAGEYLPAARAHAASGETIWLIDEAAAPQKTNDHSVHAR
ncbi:MAG: 6-phosphogluconolactonase [Xanthobacteraceae bacterium]|nr:6-phosphogluconolactonase [Xanthobacteraceae bacterium]